VKMSNPNRQTEINGVDLSNQMVTTTVEHLENGIPMCTLLANNEDGAMYLASLKVGDTVVVKGLADSNPPYTIDPIDWDIVDPCFRGEIQTAVPMLGKDAQVVQVIAFGKGYQMKEMRANAVYGAISPVPNFYNAYSFSHEFDTWAKGGQNLEPWVNGWKGAGQFSMGLISV
jgi:hypothetical protein